MKAGTLIVLEGGEGSGKDTVIAHLKKLYQERDDILFVREPGGTIVGERIREVVLDRKLPNMTITTELLLMFGSREQILHEIVRPALSQGKVVIANRFALTSVVYQVCRKEREDLRELFSFLYKEIVGDIVPFYILLDCDPEVGLTRVQARNDGLTRFDAEHIQTHKRIREAYAREVLAFPHYKIDTTEKTKDEVCEEVAKEVNRILAERI
jgi:dTMP kinase